MRAFSIAATLILGVFAAMAVSHGQAQAPEPFRLASPDVVMEADPPPPFTYWAPENATIRNHPNADDIWIAETEGNGRLFYFGDQCRASQFQHLVGKTLDKLPERAEDESWRLACTRCALTDDLRRDRINVSYDEDSKVISKIFCS